MTAVEDQDFERAVYVAAYAFLGYVHRPNPNSMALFRGRMIEVLRFRGAVMGNCVETLKLREVLDAIMERSLAIFETELVNAIGHRSPELANAIEDDLSRILRGLTSFLEESIPTPH